MKYISAIILLLAFNANCQIWKEPFDTLPYIDHFERLTGDKIGIKSYSVTQYSDKDSILSYDYYGFDKNGFLTEQFYAMFPNQHTDTNKYHYENGIVQGLDFKREHICNDAKRLIEIRSTKNDSIWSTYYNYSENRLIEIRYSEQNWTTYQYDSTGKLNRKEIFQNGNLKEYINFYYPENNVTSYCDCNKIKVWNDTINACDSIIGTFNKLGKLSKIETHIYKADSAHYMDIKYDTKGNVLVISYKEQTGNVKEIYRRNNKGILTRIDFFRENELYMYSKFDYVYY